MQSVLSFNSSRARCCRALAVALLVCFVIAGCDGGDPLPAIRQQQSAGDFEGSLEPLRKLLKKDPDDPELNFLYGRALSMTRGSNLAMWSLRKAMKDDDWLVPAASQLAFMALVATDFNEVIELAGEILEREPENVKALLYRASANSHWKKDPESALADAKRILELDPNFVEAYEPLIIALLDLGRFDEAYEVLEEAGRKVKELGTSKSVLAWHCATPAVFDQEVGKLERARKGWAACLEAHPANMDVVSSAVGFYDSQGEPDRSLEILRTAFARAPGSRSHRIMLTNRLSMGSDAAEAEAILREATSTNVPALAAVAWTDLSRLYQSQEDYGAATDALEQVLEFAREAGSPDPQLLFEYADVLVLANRFDRALEVAEQLSVPAHRRLIRGRVAQERHDPALALENFDEAVRLWPDNPFARYYAALAAEQLGDFDRALEEYRYAIRISLDATDARTRGAALLFADGEPAYALQMLRTGGDGGAPPEIEGQLLFMQLASLQGEIVAMQSQLARIEASHPGLAGKALAEAARGVATRAGDAVALSMLVSAPGVNYGEIRYAPALRALMQYSHAAGEAGSTQETWQGFLAANPHASEFQEIQALHLELSGAPPESVREAYTRALELGPQNARALEGMGRLTLANDPDAALAYFDRAAAADPSDPDPKLQAALALVAGGDPARAALRLDELLRAHPFESDAAALRARLDLEQGVATPQTLERARRAARFGRSADDLELLSRVYVQREEPKLAARMERRAEALRERQVPEGQPTSVVPSSEGAGKQGKTLP